MIIFLLLLQTVNGQRCLKEMARNLCRSSTSLVSMKSTGSGVNDNTSETASYYFSLDGGMYFCVVFGSCFTGLFSYM